jgi:hypothetical protein
MTERTCIICHKQFSPYVRHAHGTQLSRTKTTCSNECRAKADAKRKRDRHKPQTKKPATAQIRAIKRHNLKKVYVLAKCPYCCRVHDVLMSRKPLIMPRIYCRDHEWCRDEDDQDAGITRTRQRKAGGAQ